MKKRSDRLVMLTDFEADMAWLFSPRNKTKQRDGRPYDSSFYPLSEREQVLLEEQAKKTRIQVIEEIESVLEDCVWRETDGKKQLEEFEHRLSDVKRACKKNS